MSMGDYAKHAAVWDWAGHDRSNEVECWAKLAGKYGPKVLSAMCATGTIAAAMSAKGCEVTGVDITQEMIQTGQQKYGQTPGLTLIEGDICFLELAEKSFDFAFIGSTDLHHLLTREDRLAALKSLNAHTRPGGGLGLELWYPSKRSWSSPEREFYPLTSPAVGEPEVWKKGKTEYNVDSRMVTITQEVFIKTGEATEQFPHEFSLQLFELEELIWLINASGYMLVAEYGSYEFGAWTPESDKWIVEAIKVRG